MKRSPSTTQEMELAEPDEESYSYDPQNLLVVLQAVRAGDFSVRLPGDRVGLEGKIANTFNGILANDERVARELKRVGQTAGKEGRTRRRARFGRSSDAWGEMEFSINTLIDDLLWPTIEGTRVAPFFRRRDGNANAR